MHHSLHIVSHSFKTWNVLNPEYVTNIYLYRIRDNVVDMLWAALPWNSSLILGRGKRFFSLPECTQQLWDPHSFLFSGYWRHLSGVKWSVHGTNHTSLFSTEVKTATELHFHSPVCLHDMYRVNFTFISKHTPVLYRIQQSYQFHTLHTTLYIGNRRNVSMPSIKIIAFSELLCHKNIC